MTSKDRALMKNAPPADDADEHPEDMPRKSASEEHREATDELVRIEEPIADEACETTKSKKMVRTSPPKRHRHADLRQEVGGREGERHDAADHQVPNASAVGARGHVLRARVQDEQRGEQHPEDVDAEERLRGPVPPVRAQGHGDGGDAEDRRVPGEALRPELGAEKRPEEPRRDLGQQRARQEHRAARDRARPPTSGRT
jgi:hypothetical protein